MTLPTPTQEYEQGIWIAAGDALLAGGASYEGRGKLHRAIAAAILACSQRDRWQDMSSAPKDGTSIIAWRGLGSELEIVAWNADEEAWCTGSWCWHDQPTHWQPFPDAPKGGE